MSACAPLLKADAGDERVHLCMEGLTKLASLAPPISIVTFLGDGRCGKSTLASRVVHDEDLIFPVGDSGEPVTQGIDMFVREASAGGGSLVVLDCEGDNNPLGASRAVVDLVAMFMSTLTVEVVWGQIGEMQLEQIGRALAIRDRNCRKLDDGATIQSPKQKLLLVVNGCHLNYTQEYLHSIFLEVYGGSEAPRNELRANINRAYDQKQFCIVPTSDRPNYPESLSAFEREVDTLCDPVTCSGVELSGLEIVDMLKSVIAASDVAGSVPVLSITRHVMLDSFMMPFVDELIVRFEEQTMPDRTCTVYQPHLKDTRNELLQEFESKVRTLRCVELVEEARQKLVGSLGTIWDRVFGSNASIGEQTDPTHISTEHDVRWESAVDREVGHRNRCMCCKEAPIIETVHQYREYTRTRALKLNGNYHYSEWRRSATLLERNANYDLVIRPHLQPSVPPLDDRSRDTSAPSASPTFSTPCTPSVAADPETRSRQDGNS